MPRPKRHSRKAHKKVNIALDNEKPGKALGKDPVPGGSKDPVPDDGSSLPSAHSIDLCKDEEVQEKRPTSNPASRTSIKSTEWAEIIDVSQPVPDFYKQIEEMAHTYPFELDNFQKQAILKLEEGSHVFVAAHTSAGKTAIAEYAIAMSKKNNTRIIYTSPVKALSNQKFSDFSKTFGDVGLLTGDVQINARARCLVMTTEILRSMLYSDINVLWNLEFVIFDEIHYINNVERGYVWEEVLILLPAHVRVVMLSATVPNTLQFADWVGRTKRSKVYVVSTPHRPVPLRHYLYVYTGYGTNNNNQRFLILDQELKLNIKAYQDAVAAMKTRKGKKNFGGQRLISMSAKDEQIMWKDVFDHLKQQNELPVLVFTLCKQRCEENAECLMSENLTTEKEKGYIQSFIKEKLLKLNESDRKLPQVTRLQRILENGIGVHHSGILPLFKEIVEILFGKTYVKILFATETFGMGVNMPARTVVFDDLTKFDGIQRRTISAGEYIQMAGRAGRRGLDSTGTVIILCKEVVPKLGTLKCMMSGEPEELCSQFKLTYAMILSLFRTPVSVEGMIRRSFREANRTCQEDKLQKQLEIAEAEYNTTHNTPLPPHLEPLVTFYDTVAAYIKVRDEIMPRLMFKWDIAEEMTPGRIVVVTAERYLNQLGVLLHNNGSEQTPYKVLVLNTKIQDKSTYNFEVDETWYRMLSFSAMYDRGTEDSTLDHTILCIGPKHIIAITKESLIIKHQIIIDDYERRQIPRFKDEPIRPACLKVVQKLSSLSQSVRSGETTLKEVRLTRALGADWFHMQYSLKEMRDCK